MMTLADTLYAAWKTDPYSTKETLIGFFRRLRIDAGAEQIALVRRPEDTTDAEDAVWRDIRHLDMIYQHLRGLDVAE